jgi:hypothetical protein
MFAGLVGQGAHDGKMVPDRSGRLRTQPERKALVVVAVAERRVTLTDQCRHVVRARLDRGHDCVWDLVAARPNQYDDGQQQLNGEHLIPDCLFDARTVREDLTRGLGGETREGPPPPLRCLSALREQQRDRRQDRKLSDEMVVRGADPETFPPAAFCAAANPSCPVKSHAWASQGRCWNRLSSQILLGSPSATRWSIAALGR